MYITNYQSEVIETAQDYGLAFKITAEDGQVPSTTLEVTSADGRVVTISSFQLREGRKYSHICTFQKTHGATQYLLTRRQVDAHLRNMP